MWDLHCDTIAQFKALRHIQANFEPWGCLRLELIQDGIRLTDFTFATADFVYNNITDTVEIVAETPSPYANTL